MVIGGVIVTAIIVASVAVTVAKIRGGIGGASAKMDTTRLVVLPLEREGSNTPPWRGR